MELNDTSAFGCLAHYHIDFQIKATASVKCRLLATNHTLVNHFFPHSTQYDITYVIRLIRDVMLDWEDLVNNVDLEKGMDIVEKHSGLLFELLSKYRPINNLIFNPLWYRVASRQHTLF